MSGLAFLANNQAGMYIHVTLGHSQKLCIHWWDSGLTAFETRSHSEKPGLLQPSNGTLTRGTSKGFLWDKADIYCVQGEGAAGRGPILLG